MLVCEWVSLLYVCVWVGTDDLHFFFKKKWNQYLMGKFRKLCKWYYFKVSYRLKTNPFISDSFFKKSLPKCINNPPPSFPPSFYLVYNQSHLPAHNLTCLNSLKIITLWFNENTQWIYSNWIYLLFIGHETKPDWFIWKYDLS